MAVGGHSRACVAGPWPAGMRWGIVALLVVSAKTRGADADFYGGRSDLREKPSRLRNPRPLRHRSRPATKPVSARKHVSTAVRGKSS